MPNEVIFDREAIIMDLQADIAQRRQSSRLGKIFDVVVDKIIDPSHEDSADDVEVLRSLSDAHWLDAAESSKPWNLVENAGPVAIARSYHYGYDLDGVVLMPGRNLKPGQWLPAEFRAATSYDTWALPCSSAQKIEGPQ